MGSPRRRWTFLAILVFIALAVSCSKSTKHFTHGTTYGTIMVGSPEVYTRERLVNDRLQQDEWLKKMLLQSDSVEFGFQGLASRRSFTGLSSALGIEAGGAPTQLLNALLKSKLDAINRQSELERLDQEITVLKKTKELEALLQDTTIVKSDTSSTNPSSGTVAPDTLIPEVPSLYETNRLSKLTSALASPDSVAKSQSVQSPVDVFRDRLAYREELRNEIIENNLDDRHDLDGNTLYRLNFDVSVLPEYDTSAWAVVQVDLLTDAKRSRSGDVFVAMYFDWVEQMRRALEYEYTRRRYVPLNSDEELNRVLAVARTKPDVMAKHEFEPTLQALKDLRYYSKSNSADSAAYAKSKEDFDPVFRPLLVESMIKEYGTEKGLKKYLRIDSVGDSAGTRLVVEPLDMKRDVKKNTAIKEFRQALENPASGVKHRVYSYAATPKESVQRVSDVASSRAVMDLALSLGVVLGNVGAKSATKYTSMSELIAHGIRRQPLVVGFGGNVPRTANDGSKPANFEGDFGWIIGPKFTISNDGKKLLFRHSPIQNTVSALISVPAWWHELQLSISAMWVDESGKKVPVYKRPDTLTISLPGDVGELTSVLTGGQRPKPAPRTIENFKLDANAPAALIIPGEHLWRNPVVTVGDQPSDRVIVLPNMEGIIAEFDSIYAQGRRRRLVRVWTSQGMSPAGWVYVSRRNESPPKK